MPYFGEPLWAEPLEEPLEFEFGASEQREYHPERQRDDVEIPAGPSRR